MTNDEYEKSINALIPLAEDYAHRTHPRQSITKDPEWARLWDCAFLDEMDRLAHQAWLRKCDRYLGVG